MNRLIALMYESIASGSNTQSALMLLKLAAIAALVVAGFAYGRSHWVTHPLLDAPLSSDLLVRIGAAMTPFAVTRILSQESCAGSPGRLMPVTSAARLPKRCTPFSGVAIAFACSPRGFSVEAR